MEKKTQIVLRVQRVAEDIVRQLNNKYSGEMAVLVIHKLNGVLKNLNFNTHKQSLAIFLSPVFEKTFYFNIPVNETIIVSESLQVGSIMRSKKESFEMHILLLEEKESKLFFGTSKAFIKIPNQIELNEAGVQREVEYPDCKTEFCAADSLQTARYLDHIDRVLHLVLQKKSLPVFVTGNEKLISRFKSITYHQDSIIKFSPGHWHGVDPQEIMMDVGLPELARLKQKYLARLIDQAVEKNISMMTFSKIKNEIMAVGNGGILLLSEEYFMESIQGNDIFFRLRSPGRNNYSCIKTPVDELVEIVLENDVDIELVNEKLLPTTTNSRFLFIKKLY